MNVKWGTSGQLLLLAIVIYVSGIFLIKTQNANNIFSSGLATQETYISCSGDGEEYDCTSLINIKGIGNVLTYKDVYLSSIGFVIIFLVLNNLLFSKAKELRNIIFGNCIIGCFLLWIGGCQNILSSALYWISIICTCFIKDAKMPMISHMSDTRFKWLVGAAVLVILGVTAMMRFSSTKSDEHSVGDVSKSEYVYVDHTGIVHINRKCTRLNYKGMTSERVKKEELAYGYMNSFCPKCVDDKAYEELKAIIDNQVQLSEDTDPALYEY